MGHLVFLPAGDATLNRRAVKASSQALVVLQRKGRPSRLVKLGLLVDADALEAARAACLADADARQSRRERDQLRRADTAVRRQRRVRDRARRAELDVVYVANFAAHIRVLYPAAPTGIETRIAEHACLKHSRRVGRSAAAKALDDKMIRLAVVAFIRHGETEYDALLRQGVGRVKARKRVKRVIDAVLDTWRRTA